MVTRYEINAAFDYAVEERFETELSLYGGTFSAAFVAGIIKGYQKFKNRVILTQKNLNQGMNNTEIASSVVKLLGKEGIKAITEKATATEERREELRKEIRQIPLQNEKELVIFNKEWDELQKDGWMKYDNRMMNFDEYVSFRLTEELNK